MEFELDSRNCSGYTSVENQHTVFTIKMIFASIGIVVNSIAVVLFLLFKSYILLIFRILLYIMLANMLQIVVQLVELFPVTNKGNYNEVRSGKGWTTACRSFGFLDQVSCWMGHLSVLWLVLYFLYLVKRERLPITKRVGRREIIGIAICFFLPFVFNWIPFANDYYGFSGSWCWIKLTENICNDRDIGIGLAYILSLHYIPLLLFVLINTISCLAIFAMTFWMRKNAKEVVFVIIYPFIYDLFFIVACISRLYSTVRIQHNQEQSFPLWIAHSVADPCRVIIPALLAIFMVPFIRRAVNNVSKTKGELEPLNSDFSGTH